MEISSFKDLKQHCLSSGLKKNTSAGIDCPVMNEKKLGEFSKGGKETESLLEIKKSLQISRRKKKSESHFKKFEIQKKSSHNRKSRQMGFRVETGLRNCARKFVDNFKKHNSYTFSYLVSVGLKWGSSLFDLALNFSIFQLIKVKVGDGETHHYHNDYDQYCCQYHQLSFSLTAVKEG